MLQQQTGVFLNFANCGLSFLGGIIWFKLRHLVCASRLWKKKYFNKRQQLFQQITRSRWIFIH